MNTEFLERIKYSPLSRWAALPLRLGTGVRPLLQQTAAVARWLVQSREWANFNCEYEPEGLAAIVCALSVLTGRSHAEINGFADEIKNDALFAQRYHQRLKQTRLRYTCDAELRYGRFMVNYMMVRASRARVVFEAGTDKGLGTWAMCRALHRNRESLGPCLLITADVRGDRGEFLEGDEGGLVRRLVGDSVAALRASTESIDLFLHDTVNDPAHSRAQFDAVAQRLAPRAMVHTCWFNLAFVEFCERCGMSCVEYVERVKGHWYPGGRCGIAARR